MRKAIEEELHSPTRSMRLQAIGKILLEGDSPQALELLQQRAAVEEDAECRILLTHAAAAVQDRISTLPGEPGRSSPDEFREAYLGRSTGDRIRFLTRLPAKEILRFRGQAPCLLEQENDPVAASVILLVFGGQWPEDELPAVARQLTSSRLSTRLAALEILVRSAPRRLERELPSLLVSDDPRIRTLAIRGLSQIDMGEAIAHLDALLGNHDRQTRLAGIKNCFYFPFPLVKPVLLKFLAAEADLQIIEAGGVLLKINPDIEVPFRLWEIWEFSAAAKAAKIQEILRDSFQALEKSKLLGENFPAYRDRLQAWIDRRRAGLLARELVARLSSGEDASEGEFRAVLERALEKPVFREVLAQLKDTGLPAEVWEKIAGLLDQRAASEQPARPAGPGARWEDLSEAEKVRRVASWELEDQEVARPVLERIIAAASTSPELKAAGLRTAQRLDCANFCDEADRELKNPDPNLATAALAYLSHFDPDRVFPFLGSFLNSSNIRVKSTAIRILKQVDPVQAVSSLKTMLAGTRIEQRAAAMACLVFFEFSLVRETLVHLLESNIEPDLFEPALAMFLENPDPESLYPLFRLEKLLGSERAARVRSVRQRCEEVLARHDRLGGKTPSQLGADWEQRWKAEQERRRAPPPAYALATLQGTGSSGSAFGALGQVGRQFVERYGLWVPLLFSIVVGAGLWFAAAEPGAGPDQVALPVALVPSPQAVVGIVQEVRGDGRSLVVQTKAGETFLVMTTGAEFEYARMGDNIHLTVLPYQKRPDGTILAYFQSFGN